MCIAINRSQVEDEPVSCSSLGLGGDRPAYQLTRSEDKARACSTMPCFWKNGNENASSNHDLKKVAQLRFTLSLRSGPVPLVYIWLTSAAP